MKIPKHVAVIMDGNGRWAQSRGLPRVAGHYEGVKRAEELVNTCMEYGISYLTLYTFSTENWKRPREEVQTLFSLFESYMKSKKDEFIEKEISVNFIGRRDRLPKDLLKIMEDIQTQTSHLKRIKVYLAIDYGGRDEIVRAVNKILERGIKEIDEKAFSSYLDLGDVPDPDLLIRTAGEKRLSNFLLWNLAYTELYFTDVYWPDFTKEEFIKALEDYAKRKRKFGALV